MKSFPLALIFCIAPYVQAAATPPPSAAGCTISVDLYQAQQCNSEMYQEPTGYWFDMPRTPLRLDKQAAETLFRFVEKQKKHPFGVHVLSRMGRMLTWACYAKLSEKEFVDTVLSELYEARIYWKKQKTKKH